MNNLKNDKSILLSCLKKSFAEIQKIRKKDDGVNIETDYTRQFQNPIFFQEWFKVAGESYYFVFKKNLKVTNIQYAELVSLLKRHIKNTGIKSDNIQFYNVDEFNEAITQLVNTFIPKEFKKEPNFPDLDDKLNLIIDLYSDLLTHAIVIDAFYGSCAVFLPHNIEIQIEKICSFSGYIHTCGHNIYIRKIEKANKEDFFNSLQEYINKNICKEDLPISFAVYAHEDFTQHDRDEGVDMMKHGIDDIKMYIEKLTMQTEPLAKVISELKERFTGKINVIPSTGFKNENFPKGKQNIWLSIDKSIKPYETDSPGKDIYLICYNQLYKNENPFHEFDENKPAWIDHTTIPHTLMGAMINITVPFWKKDSDIFICDPFIGTGTTLFEALKYKELKLTGSDKNEITELLISDNLYFFGLGESELSEIISILKISEDKFEKFIKGDKDFNPLYGADYKTAEEFVNKNIDSLTKKMGDISKEDVVWLKSQNERTRLMIYLALKTYIRNFIGFDRESKDWTSAFLKEIIELKKQTINLRSIKKREDGHELVLKQLGLINIYQANYSLASSYNSVVLREFKDKSDFQNKISSGKDAIDTLKKNINKFDLIITDPPYGYNTDENTSSFAKLYSNLIRHILLALKDEEGQLVICLPERSLTGKHINFFTQKEIITIQLFEQANELGKEIISEANSLPNPKWLYTPPYYWESEKSLRRAILHFRVRKKN